MNNNESVATGTETADNKESAVQEPPLKRIKVDSGASQIPHYNSHNIYSRPPAPPANIAIPQLPNIMDPVTPLDDDTDSNHNHTNAVDALLNAATTIAPLAEPTEQWPLCAYCNKGGDLSRCSSCRQSYYCNRDCQVAHWEVHCIVCQPGPPQPPSLPQGGQPVAPPTTFTHYPNAQMPQYPNARQSPYSNGAYSTTNGHKTSRKRTPRSYDLSDGVNKEQYYCEECDRYFKNGQALGGHRSRVHSSRRNGSMEMDADGNPRKRRRSRPSRARHEPTGSGQYVCPHCGREFATGNALGGHISGAHTKKSRRAAQQQAYLEQQSRYARPRHPNL